MSKVRRLLSACVLATLPTFAAAQALAPAAPAATAVPAAPASVAASRPSATPAAAPAPSWQLRATHGSWTVICLPAEAASPGCQAVQVMETRTVDKPPQRVLRLMAQKAPDGIVLDFELPFGLDLRPGMVYQIDNADEVVLPYLTCLPGGCVASQKFAGPQSGALAGGTQMKVGIRPLGTDKVLVIEIKLDGLDKALQAF